MNETVNGTPGAVEIENLLRGLGSTVAEVKDKLESLNIKGKRRSLCNCPVAKYLSLACLGRTFIVEPSETYFGSGDCATNPLPVRGFITAFDYGSFPELLEVSS